jgi:hypothetical protein
VKTSEFVNWWPASKAKPGSLAIGEILGETLCLESKNRQFAVLNKMNDPSPTGAFDEHVIRFASHHRYPSSSSPWNETGSRSLHGEKHGTLRHVKHSVSDG